MKGDRPTGKLNLRQLVMLSLLVAVSGGLSVPVASVLPMSVAIAQTTDERKTVADLLFWRGIQQYRVNRYEDAIASWEAALKIYREVSDRNREANTLMNQGVAYADLYRYTNAVEQYNQALPIFREVNDRDGEARVLMNRGNAYLSLSRYTDAIEQYNQALPILREIKSRNGEAAVLMNRGSAYLSLSRYIDAIEQYNQALPIFRQIDDRTGEASALGNIGIAYASLSRYTDAIEQYNQALPILREIKNRNSEATVLMNRGAAYASLSRYIDAIEQFNQALRIFRQINDRTGEAKALTDIGIAYVLLSRYTDAIEQLNQALPILREVNDRNSEALALMNQGIAYGSLSRYTDAIEQFNQALPILREVQDRNGEAKALTNAGIAYLFLSRYADAIEQFNQALPIFRKVQDRNGEANTLTSIGLAYKSLSHYNDAVEQYNQALSIYRQVKNRNGEATALMNRGLAYSSLSRYGDAIEQYNQALPIFRAVNDRSGEAKALNNLGLTYFKINQLTQAEPVLRQAIAINETIRLDRLSDANKISLFETQATTYRTLQEVLIAQNQPEAALSISEWGRAKALVELLTARSTGDTKTATSPSQSAAPSIQQIRQVAQAQNATLIQYSIISEDVERTREDQAPTQASRIYIWVIKPTGEITFRNVDLKPFLQQQTLWELVLISRSSIGVRGLPDRASARIPPEVIARIQQAEAAQAKSNLQRLHQILIAPIADLLPQDPDQHVIFLPQDELYLVPFAALQDANGKYLIEQHTILTAPSIQTLALTQQQKAKLNPSTPLANALVVGNPTMPKLTEGALDPLPGAAQEANAIAPLLRTQSLTGNQATKTAIVQQMPQASIIHLATHGLVDTANGFGSAIALAPDRPGTPNDGLLTAEEIFAMKLKAELVVLSACDTGRGRITGDGVVGLSRSLITAGVPSILVSLWSIPDAPTAELMTDFYQNWQTRRMDKAQALRQAMLTTLKTHPQPKNWAAFTLIGEP